MSTQVVSKQRVVDHGEVYTSRREVDAMLDLVKNETERIDSRFLEPACGHGNFLEAILERKLDAVEKRYKKSQTEFEAQGLVALASIYGIDKLEDNVREARRRLFQLFLDRYTRLFRKSIDARYFDSLNYVLQRNIIHGDALSLKTIPAEGLTRQNGRPTLESLRNEGKPIVFSEWKPITSTMIKRRDFSFEELLNKSDGPLFDDTAAREKVFEAKPLAEYKPVHYLDISHAYDDAIQSRCSELPCKPEQRRGFHSAEAGE
jgi:hypothetical protein